MGKLNAITIKNAKPKDKPYKLADGYSMFLLINPPTKTMKEGSYWWRYSYRLNGKQKQISLGTYPDVSLAQARVKCHEARELVAQGIDPSTARKDAKDEAQSLNENSFETVTHEWLTTKLWAQSTIDKVVSQLNRHIFPWLGKRPIAEITAPELLKVLRRVEGLGVHVTAHRLRATCGQIFRYAIATERADRDIAADLREALVAADGGHHPAVTEPKEVAQLLRAIDSLNGSFVVCSAMKLAPLLFARPGELRHAEWEEIDLEEGLWRVPAEKMKLKLPHIVPLCRQAIEILEELYPLTCRSKYVFPNIRSAAHPMSDVAMGAALARLGYKNLHTPHGFRATARTILDEVLHESVDIIEHQLSHTVKDSNGRAYNRTSHLPARIKMMQRWANYLDGLKKGAQIIPLHRREA